jgi:hypothetical protein
MENKKPDNVVDTPNLMPYPTNVSAPVFVPTNIPAWKSIRVGELNTDFKDRYDGIRSELDKLNEDVEINTILYTSKYNFEPKVGEPYHLYLNSEGEPFLSLIDNDEWGVKRRPTKYLGTFVLDWKNKWNRYKK